MELSLTDMNTLRDMVSKEWFPHEERELESTFGVDGVVDSTRFLAVAQRLKSKGLKEIRQPDRLTISLEDNTRYTIQGEGTIAQYCQDNKIVGKSAVIMIKDRAGDLHTLDLKEYDTRIKIRRELGLDLQDPRVKSHFATWDQRVKFFRLIQRWTFRGKGVIFDLSMVRSTKKDDRGLWKQVKKFYDEDLHHNIMKEQPVYEIEVELDRESEDADTPEKALQCLVQGMGEILKGIQRNPILIRNSVREKALQGYNRLVGADSTDGRKRGFRGVQPVTLERENILPEVGKPGNLILGSPASTFNVTDKADGLRVMGYCNDKGELFMIDMGLNVYRTGLKKLACAETLVDGEWITQNKEREAVQMFMLFDIYHGLDGKKTDTLPFYSVQEAIDTRYKALQAWGAKWRSEGGPIPLVKGLTPQNSLKVLEKKFLFGLVDPPNDIFVKCGQMLARNVIYNTDGLILTTNVEPIPPNFGVRFAKQFKWKPSEDNTIDFLVKIVKDSETGLDKLTDIIRPDSQDTIKYKTCRLYVGTSADPAYDDPRRTILLIKKLPSGRPGGKGTKRYRMRPVLFSPKAFEDSSASVCNLEATRDVATNDWIIRCTSKTDAPGEATGDPITNNSIVEMRYDADPSLPSGWNWIPLRVRYDKTERFQSGSIEKTLNSIETAESVWKSIHEPITKHMISTGSSAPSEEELQEMKIKQEQKVAEVKRYYQKKSSIKNISLVKSMATFHNLVIKGNILTTPILMNTSLGLPSKKVILDTSIGKGGDLGRYYEYASFLVGIDLDADGIRDPDEGAYRRYLERLVEQTRNRFIEVPPMVFLIGDSTKSYVDGTSGINDEEGDMMRAVFGKVGTKAKVPPYIDSKCRGKLKDGADFMSSMFSIHYYFESKDKWTGFLNNIRDNLKVGGFFVCCCFDGVILTSQMEDLDEGEALEGVDPLTNSMIWRIAKANSLGGTLPSTAEEGFGHAIDVEFLSIGSVHREYLVNPTLLVEQMRSIGCELTSANDLRALGLPSATELFKTTYYSVPGYKELYPMSDEVADFSFFNRWFVFRRYGTAPGAQQQEPSSPPYVPVSPAYGSTSFPPRPGAPGFPPQFGPQSPAYTPASPKYTPSSPAYVVGATEVAVYPFELPPGWTTEVARDGEYTKEPTRIFLHTKSGKKFIDPPNMPMYPPQGFTMKWNEEGGIDYVEEATGKLSYTVEGDNLTGMSLYDQPPLAQSPLYSPSTPTYGSMTAAAAALYARPRSTAWGQVPLSGNLEQNTALQLQGQAQRASLALQLAGEPELPPRPLIPNDANETTARQIADEWQARMTNIRERAMADAEPRLDRNLTGRDRAEELDTIADMAVAAAIERYQARQQGGPTSGLVTAVVEGGTRTVAVEKGIAAGPQKKYKPNEVFRFFGRAELKDALKIGDPGAARWLALSAPFSIKDGAIEYPTVNHYLAGMKYKLSTDKPELGADLFSSKGTIHTKYLRLREDIATKHKGDKEKGQVKEAEDQELLRNEAADVADAALPKTIKRYKAQFNEAQWIAQKDDVLKKALEQRWKHDARFRKIVEEARTQNKYLLYYTGSTTITSFGGVRRDDGRIEGENQVGKIIMELAGYPPV